MHSSSSTGHGVSFHRGHSGAKPSVCVPPSCLQGGRSCVGSVAEMAAWGTGALSLALSQCLSHGLGASCLSGDVGCSVQPWSRDGLVPWSPSPPGPLVPGKSIAIGNSPGPVLSTCAFHSRFPSFTGRTVYFSQAGCFCPGVVFLCEPYGKKQPSYIRSSNMRLVPAVVAVG